MKLRELVLAGFLSLSLLTGCTGNMTASADEIVTKVLENGKDMQSYYGKSVMKIYEGEELQNEIEIEEFVNAEGKRKVITTDLNNENARSYTLNDGEKVITYDENENVAFQFDISGEAMPTSMTQKEQLVLMLENVKQTHTQELVGEEKILDFDTQHIKLKAKEKDGIIGDIELWVEEKSWFIVKFNFDSGDLRTEQMYEEIDFSPKFEKDTFTLDLPADVEIKEMEEDLIPETGTLEEAEKMLGEPFLVFSGEAVELDKVEWDELKGIVNRTELTLSYKVNAVLAFTVSVFKTPEEKGTELKESEYKVRGQKTEYWKEINALTWDENGLRYSIIIEDPNLTPEEVIALTENMKLSSEME